jgi:putative endonuclease
MMKKVFYIYVLTNKNHSVIYIGVTSDLGQRVIQHKSGFYRDAFSNRYNLTKLVYYEVFDSIEDAIKR